MEEIRMGDVVKMRKTHPCGSDEWTVIRIGADVKIKCLGCGRIVMMERADFIGFSTLPPLTTLSIPI